MSKIKLLLCSFILVVGLYGCTGKEKEVFNTKQVYLAKQANLQLRSMKINDTVKPINQNDKFLYRSSEGKKVLDLQFYFENKTDEELDVCDVLNGRLIVDNKTLEHEVCVESENYTKIDADTKIEPKEKTIVHVLFWFDKEKLDQVKSNEIEISVDDIKYILKYEAMSAKENKIEKEQKISFEDFDLTVLSSSASQYIPALNFENGDFDSYTSEDKKQFAGGYIEIANKTNRALDLNKELPVYLDIAGKKYQPMWLSILSENEAKFEDTYEIPAHETRKVLIFKEVPRDKKDTEYTFHFIIDGMSYSYTYTHLVVAG